VIGRRGETLDALQYLSSLVANRIEGDYIRISLDSCGYREKREETLKSLAERISEKVLKNGRSTVLEPMNPYERRIIHSVVSKIDGVNSKSIGEEPYRKIVISSDNPKKYNNKRKKNNNYKKSDERISWDYKTSFEKDYKKPKPEDDINAGLYGKIEL
ncbi:MAG: single-stranded DNA-binding protein, partial [Oscillospiraceae bacterium]|nr:single-stranded DNA-binding protein [Oscillospiraceae bacterium]